MHDKKYNPSVKRYSDEIKKKKKMIETVVIVKTNLFNR